MISRRLAKARWVFNLAFLRRLSSWKFQLTSWLAISSAGIDGPNPSGPEKFKKSRTSSDQDRGNLRNPGTRKISKSWTRPRPRKFSNSQTDSDRGFWLSDYWADCPVGSMKLKIRLSSTKFVLGYGWLVVLRVQVGLVAD